MSVPPFYSTALVGFLALSAGVSASLNGPNNGLRNLAGPKVSAEPTCTTQECVIAAGHLIENMDATADPCDDFYQYACGGWIENNVIPDTGSKWGVFYELGETVDQQIKAVIEQPPLPGDADSVVELKTLYSGCLDTDGIEAAGYSGFIASLVNDATGGWPMVQAAYDNSNYDWETVAGDNHRFYLTPEIIATFPYLDTFDTSRNILYLDQALMTLPLSMYLDPAAYDEVFVAYRQYIIDVAAIITRESGDNVLLTALETAADNIIAFEKNLAKGLVASQDRRNATEMYNPFTYAELKAEYPINWDAFLGKIFEDTTVVIDDSEPVIVVEPEYFDWLLPLLISSPDDVVADYLYWGRAKVLTNEGPKEMRDAAFAFSSVLYGITEPSPQWRHCMSLASSETKGFAYAVGHEYLKDHFDDESRQLVDSLVDDLRAAFIDLLDESVWMDAATQVLAKEKVDLMVQLVGYADWMTTNEGIDEYYTDIPSEDIANHYGNLVLNMAYAGKRGFETLRSIPNREDWITQPAIVNAFYSPQHNSISFPAGILQPPFFGKGYPRYLNYGAIGVVMGHEITHGFDNSGRQYDGVGNAAQWWSDETIAAFDEEAQCYIDQYDAYEVPELEPILGDDAHVNGLLTEGENIADNGGLHESFRAYQSSVAALGEEGPLPGLEAFTSEQMFFISYAQVWCEKASTEAQINQLLTDPHSPGKFRVWGPLSNSPDFVAAYGCPVESNMNRGDEMCTLW